MLQKKVSIPRQVWPFPVHPGLQTHCRSPPEEDWEQLALASQTTPPHFKPGARQKTTTTAKKRGRIITESNLKTPI